MIAQEGLTWFALGDGRQPADTFLDRLLDYISGASRSLEIAIYDLRLGNEHFARLRDVLAARRAAGVRIRLV